MPKPRKPSYKELEAHCANLKEEYDRMANLTERAVSVGEVSAQLVNQTLEEVIELRAEVARIKGVTLN